MIFIPEEEYVSLIKKIPIFCIDLLILQEQKFLLVKRKHNPMKNEWWFPGGRLRYRESLDDCFLRIIRNELGLMINIKSANLFAFNNYLFDSEYNSRALHTPAITFCLRCKSNLNPILDEHHSEYCWTNKLPKNFLDSYTYINKSLLID